MNWKLKSTVIRIVEALPMSSQIYYALQKYVTRSIPRSRNSVRQSIVHEQGHLSAFRKHTGRDFPNNVYEFGAGWDLCSSIIRCHLGVRNQHMVDLFPLASPWQVNQVITHVVEEIPGALSEETIIDNMADSLTAKLDIKYSAPFDARDSGLPPESIDLIVSTNTLEHIPFEDLARILQDCRKIISPQGLMSMKIDYSDHYSHADSTIGPYNFLQFSESEWARHNHDFHYQSRMRHSDYEALFLRCGFEILSETSLRPADPDATPSAVLLAEAFSGYTVDNLSKISGWFVLKPKERD